MLCIEVSLKQWGMLSCYCLGSKGEKWNALLKGVIHPQKDDYSCLGHLSSIVFICVCRIPKTKMVLANLPPLIPNGDRRRHGGPRLNIHIFHVHETLPLHKNSKQNTMNIFSTTLHSIPIHLINPVSLLPPLLPFPNLTIPKSVLGHLLACIWSAFSYEDAKSINRTQNEQKQFSK